MSPTLQTPINGVIVFGGQSMSVAQLPAVPGDRKEVLEAAGDSKWRIAEGNRAECVRGLREIEVHGEDLGDLVPSQERCGAVANELDTIWAFLARLEALRQYVEARRAVIEPKADAMLREAYEEVTRRIERGRVPAESYGGVRDYVEAHGASVALGLARASKVRAEMKVSAPANDAHAPAKTGTDNR